MSSRGEPPKELISAIRQDAGLSDGEGPSDRDIARAIEGFAEQFDYWFRRVIAGSVDKYRTIVIRRINALVRPIELDGLSSDEVAARLVSDYVNRNFVTAGGWAIEKMAIEIASVAGGAKAATKGIDLDRTDDKGNRHLYVIKSGKVTRNSDILSKLKQHTREAEKLIRQGGAKVGVFANYVVAAGATTSTFEDGIYRPSSGQFWSEVTNLPEDKALRLVSAMAKAGGQQVARDTDAHIGALVTLVSSYIHADGNRDRVDWDFVFKTTMTDKKGWSPEDQARHKRAMGLLAETGYKIVKPSKRISDKSEPKGTKVLAKRGRAARKAGTE